MPKRDTEREGQREMRGRDRERERERERGRAEERERCRERERDTEGGRYRDGERERQIERGRRLIQRQREILECDKAGRVRDETHRDRERGATREGVLLVSYSPGPVFHVPEGYGGSEIDLTREERRLIIDPKFGH